MQSGGREEGDQDATGEAGDDQMLPRKCRAEKPWGSRHRGLGEEAERHHVRCRRHHRSVHDGRWQTVGGWGISIGFGGSMKGLCRPLMLPLYNILRIKVFD
ncbi:unnamed protein product [Musa acuminata var. zebrina]